MTFDMMNFQPALAEIFFLAMTCVVILVEVFTKDEQRNLTYILAQLTLIGSLALTIKNYSSMEAIMSHGLFILDRIGSLFKVAVYVISFFVFLYSRDYVKERNIPFGEYYILSLFSILGMLVLISSYNLISLYLGLELLSLPLYALVALRRDSVVSSEAAMKYFVTGAVASGMLLYGMSMLYGATGHLELNEIFTVINSKPADQMLVLSFGLVFLVVGIAFKLGAVPFHMWIPDVYDGAPTSVTLFIATAPKIAAFALGIRLLVNAMPILHLEWQQLLISIAILSMALGNFVAIAQSNIKRMLAYSSIAHIGYALLGLLAATPEGYAAGSFYIITYGIMSLAAFGILVLLSRTGVEIESIEDFKGLNGRNPWLAFLMLIVLFSMAGIPPIVGFFAKMAVLEALINVHLVWLAALALLFAIVGAYYYIRVVKVMYFDEPLDPAPVSIGSYDLQLAISLNGLLVLVLGLFPGGLFELCRAAF